MRLSAIRMPILAALVWAGVGASVWARNRFYSETVYLAPTAATVAWPTSYFATTSYVVPSAYVSPTYYSMAYYPTAYVDDAITLAPSSYLTTAYTVRRGLFGRLRLVERPVIASYPTTYMATSYYLPSYYATSYRTAAYYTPTVYSPTVYRPSTYVYPTAWETGYARASDVCCDQVAWAAPVSTAPALNYSPPRGNGSSRAVRSDPMDDPTLSSSVGPAPLDEPKSVPKPSLDERKNDATAKRADTPPAAPSAGQEKSATQPAAGSEAGTNKAAEKPAGAVRPLAPSAPGGGQNEPSSLEPAPGADNTRDTVRRDNLRPIYATRSLRNVLIGRVESDAGDPLVEVPVTVTNRDNSAVRREGMTNAFGNFAIRLGEGEWTVNVRMPSGRVYPVRSIRVTGDKIIDNQEGREVRNLIISY